MNELLSATCHISGRSLQNGVSSAEHWSGTMYSSSGSLFCLTTFSPLANLLPCQALKSLNENALNVMNFPSVACHVKVQHGSEHINDDNKYIKLDAKPILSWKSVRFSKFTQMLCLDAADEGKSSVQNQEDNNQSTVATYLSWFLILELDIPAAFENNFINQIKSFRSSCIVYQGNDVWTSSCPFGNLSMEVFSSCVSRGILCHVTDDTMFLTDARCLPGSEGAGLYDSDYRFIGMVFSSIVLKSGEQTGLSLACSFLNISKSFLGSYKMTSESQKSLIKPSSYSIFEPFSLVTVENLNTDISPKSSRIGQEIVVIENSSGWGSGVIVSLRFIDSNSAVVYIATCRHVAANSSSRSLQVRVKCCCGTDRAAIYKGSVLYHTKFDSWIDFALVSFKCSKSYADHLISHSQNSFMKRERNMYIMDFEQSHKVGSDVFARGHAIFENHGSDALVCRGNISSIMTCDSVLPDCGTPLSAVLLHSTCIVHVGMSGGGLFSKDHKLAGLIVNNMRELLVNDDDEKPISILYPTINFILPAGVFMPYVLKFFANFDKNVFSPLDTISDNRRCRDIWLLSPNNANANSILSKL